MCVQTLTEHGQAWDHGHFPRELVAVLDHPLSEGFFPDIQYKAIPPHPITREQRSLLSFVIEYKYSVENLLTLHTSSS